MLIYCSDEALNKGAAQYDIYEARAIGIKIREMIDSGIKITENGIERPCSYKDFCILLQTGKNKACLLYTSVAASFLGKQMEE